MLESEWTQHDNQEWAKWWWRKNNTEKKRNEKRNIIHNIVGRLLLSNLNRMEWLGANIWVFVCVCACRAGSVKEYTSIYTFNQIRTTINNLTSTHISFKHRMCLSVYVHFMRATDTYDFDDLMLNFMRMSYRARRVCVGYSLNRSPVSLYSICTKQICTV